MTLTLAWTRSECSTPELVVASDSRLSPFAWDAGPKVFALPRGDAAIAFAGETFYAYPMILQALQATRSFFPALSRRQDLNTYKGHILRLMNGMLSDIKQPLTGSFTDIPGAFFILAGYSWTDSRFRIWTLHFDKSVNRFTFRPATPWGGGNYKKMLTVVGDEPEAAKTLIRKQLALKGRLDTGGFDMEPLAALLQLIDDPSKHTIGGYPQLLKVYRSLNCAEFVVARQGVRSLGGRRLLAYEFPDQHPIFTIDDEGTMEEAQQGLEPPD